MLNCFINSGLLIYSSMIAERFCVKKRSCTVRYFQFFIYPAASDHLPMWNPWTKSNTPNKLPTHNATTTTATMFSICLIFLSIGILEIHFTAVQILKNNFLKSTIINLLYWYLEFGRMDFLKIIRKYSWTPRFNGIQRLRIRLQPGVMHRLR